MSRSPTSVGRKGKLVARRISENRTRINAAEDSELAYWATSLGVTKERLREVVGKVGESVSAIRAELARTRKD
jgi:hypothetical protein